MTDIEHCLICLGESRIRCNRACPCPHDGHDITARDGYCAHPVKAVFGDGVRPDGWEIIPVDEAWKKEVAAAKPPEKKPPVQPIPRAEWPLWASALAAISAPEDAGAGDVIKRLANSIPAPILLLMKAAKMVWTGETNCQCEEDRRRLNQLYPLQQRKHGDAATPNNPA